MDEYAPSKSFTVDVILRRVAIFGREIGAAIESGHYTLARSMARDLENQEKVIGPGARKDLRGLHKYRALPPDASEGSPDTTLERMADSVRDLPENTPKKWGFKS